MFVIMCLLKIEFELSGIAPMAGPYDFSRMIMEVFTSNDYPLAVYEQEIQNSLSLSQI